MRVARLGAVATRLPRLGRERQRHRGRSDATMVRHRRSDVMKNLISRFQRELPDTDKDRYDVAYERGATQKRSGTLFGGLAIGAVAGLVAMYLLDPVRGAARRAQPPARGGGVAPDAGAESARIPE